MKGAKKIKKRKAMNWGLMALAVPGLFFLIAYYYVPLFGLVIPFKKMDVAKGIFGSDWCGLDNFKFFFQSPDVWTVTRNTIGLNALFITMTLILSVVVALGLFELSKRKVKVFQTCLFVPYFISWVVGSYVIYALLSPDMGVIPNLMEKFNMTPPNFYSEPKYWPFILTTSYFWKHVGYNALIFYATLMGMDISQHEAAAIDGATKIQRIRFICLPHLMPTIVLMALLMIGKIFYADFGMFWFLPRNSGVLYPVTDVIDTYVFRMLRVMGNIGMSSAVGLYQSVVGFILVLVTNLIVKKRNEDYALF
ncbi:MAG TPA: sugar ABC transporter permease [Candidatus Pelethocola excrementipullorum]|nr:sugar ABC transporter permease [Candidatus Pelethocola excrementipullorum]